MKTSKAITNQYQDFHVLNLCQLVHHVEGRGPYMVTQDGCDPDDPNARECSFVLTRRGTWLHFYLYIALPEGVRARIAQVETIADVLRCADSLPPKVVLEDTSSLQELIREAGFEPGVEDVTAQALLRELKKRHGVAASDAGIGNGPG